MAVTNTTSSQYSPCQFYKVRLNPADGTPLLTTMQSYDYKQIVDPCIEALLPPYQMAVPPGKTRCFPKNHQRFYYKVNRITGKIVPNSMFTKLGQTPRCDGQNSILEYLVHN